MRRRKQLPLDTSSLRKALEGKSGLRRQDEPSLHLLNLKNPDICQQDSATDFDSPATLSVTHWRCAYVADISIRMLTSDLIQDHGHNVRRKFAACWTPRLGLLADEQNAILELKNLRARPNIENETLG